MTDPAEFFAARVPIADAGAVFRHALLGDDAPVVDLSLLPARLARAACVALNVDGAGIGVIDDYFRVPLGASDDVASYAERLQFTCGEGPCLEAVQAHRLVSATAAQMLRRWPLFAAQLLQATPYRAVLSLPIGAAATSFGALDLYLLDEAALPAIGAVHTTAVVEQIHEALMTTASPAPGPLSGKPEPTWMHGNASQTRMAVWIAIGTLMADFDIADPDALALLRAYAFSHDDTVDETARRINEGELATHDLAP